MPRAAAEGLDAVIVNPASVIGQRDVNFVGGEILRAAKRGQLVCAPPGGMGIVSARAVGVGHLLAAERGRTGERYILNGENILHRALMTQAAEVAGRRPPVCTIPRALVGPAAALLDVWNGLRRASPLIDGCQMRLSARDMYFDGSKAQRDLGFASDSVRAALTEAWNWYRERGLL